MNNLSIKLTQLLYTRFCTIWADKFVKDYHTPQFISLWWEDWSEGLAGIDPSEIKDALNYCRTNLEWPPSMAEFRRICETASGIPIVADAFHKAIRRDFTHPVISLAYERVGSWDMKNDKQEVLAGKFQAAYIEAINAFRANPEKAWKQLEQFNENLLLPEPLPKIPSKAERKSFRERLAEYEARAKEEKEKLVNKPHPVWDKASITQGHNRFDEKIFNERRNYLLSLSEIEAGTLSNEDCYDRIRYFRQIDGANQLRQSTPGNPSGSSKKEPYRPNSGERWYNGLRVVAGFRGID